MKKLLAIVFFLLIGLQVYSQKRIVTGLVVDDTGTPLPGAVIMEVGTNNGTITDKDGIYSIEVSSDAKLQASYIGYITVEQSVKGKTYVHFILYSDMPDVELDNTEGQPSSSQSTTRSGLLCPKPLAF